MNRGFLGFKKKGSKILWFILAIYIFAQLIWWTFLLLTLLPQEEISQQADKKIKMVIGESAFFFLILILFFYQVYRILRREILLKQHQNDFLFSMSHELKTPLTMVQLGLETLLKRKDLPPDTKADLMENILKEHQRFHQLVQNILTAANIEQKQHFSDFISLKPFNFSDFCQKWVYKNKQFVQDSDLEPHIFILADETFLASIFFNLSENARYHNSPDTKISLKLYRAENWAYLEFKDDGQGIANQEKKKIFDKFYKIPQAKGANLKGTGLGLYIVAQIVLAHQGQIDIGNNQPKGTVFILKIPLQK